MKKGGVSKRLILTPNAYSKSRSWTPCLMQGYHRSKAPMVVFYFSLQATLKFFLTGKSKMSMEYQPKQDGKEKECETKSQEQ